MHLRKISTRAAAFTAVTAAALAGGGYALASSSGPSSHAAAATTFYGCINTSSNTLVKIKTASFSTCPKGSVKVQWNEQGPQGPKGATGPQGPPGPSDLTVSATTNVSNRDDSGGNGNWATDTFTRDITITRHEAGPVANCGGNVAECWYYTGTISDNGMFTTDSGAYTPNQGCSGCSGEKISGTVDGTFTGGSAIEFWASSNAPDASLVPASVSGDSPSTGDWAEQFFASGTVFSGPANLINFSWTYVAPGTCEQWTEAASNSDGQSPSAGNISGVNQCN